MQLKFREHADFESLANSLKVKERLLINWQDSVKRDNEAKNQINLDDDDIRKTGWGSLNKVNRDPNTGRVSSVERLQSNKDKAAINKYLNFLERQFSQDTTFDAPNSNL